MFFLSNVYVLLTPSIGFRRLLSPRQGLTIDFVRDRRKSAPTSSQDIRADVRGNRRCRESIAAMGYAVGLIFRKPAISMRISEMTS